MDIRQANPGDVEAIREVARASLRASYDEIEAGAIDEAVEQWYAQESVEEHLADGNALYLVAEREGEIAGFSQSEVIDGDPPTGQLHWVHVAPPHRGHGIGEQLLSRTEETLHARGVGSIEAVVLEANEVGNEFYEGRGFERAGAREIEIGGESFTENAYVKGGGAVAPEAGLDVRELPDGREVFVDLDDPQKGSKAPFFPAYYDRERTDRHGLLCDNCGSADTAMDTMGRVECGNCNNTAKATRWDAAYL